MYIVLSEPLADAAKWNWSSGLGRIIRFFTVDFHIHIPAAATKFASSLSVLVWAVKSTSYVSLRLEHFTRITSLLKETSGLKSVLFTITWWLILLIFKLIKLYSLSISQCNLDFNAWNLFFEKLGSWRVKLRNSTFPESDHPISLN